VAGLHPDLLGELKRSPRFPSRNQGGPTSKVREGREGEGREGSERGGEEERRGEKRK